MLTKTVQRSFLVDSRWREEKSAEETGACLEPVTVNPELRGVYTVLKRWYHHVSAREPNPLQEGIDKVKEDHALMYWQE